MSPPANTLLSCLALASAFLLAGCRKESPPPHPNVIVVAVDGLDWSVVGQMFGAGRLPNLARLVRRGTAGELATMHPSLSPAIWTSVATGMRPARHGIRGFVRSEAGRQVLYTSRDRRTKALWNIASDHDLETAVIGWWNTFPVEPLRGVMVAQTNVTPEERNENGGILKGGLRPDRPHQVEPPSLAPRILALADAAAEDLDGTLRRIFPGVDPAAARPALARLWNESRWALRADLQYERIALDLLASRSGFDLFLVYLGGTDVLAHRFWRWAYPGQYAHPPEQTEVAAYGSILFDYYAHVDAVLGRIVAAAPAHSVVIVMSDHGMVAANRTKRFAAETRGRPPRTGMHGRTEAFFAVSGPGIRAAQPALRTEALRRETIPKLGSIFDVAPTVLHLLGIPVGRDMPGRVLEGVLDPAWLAAHPVRQVATHTPPSWSRSRALPEVATPGADERLEQLRSLGYIE